jgi:hypothetical protein
LNEEIVLSCARDEETRIRMLAGFLASLLQEKRVLINKVLDWVKVGFRQAQEALLQGKDEVDAFRKVA